jgi:hypothetical protein
MKQGTVALHATFLILTSITGARAASAPAQPTAPALGQLDFPITGSLECQRLFRQGMLEMHSFQYDQAHASFGAALKTDAGCAMAAWGDAMAYEHPVWAERDLAKGKAALARITSEDALTPREKAHIAAARALYGIPEGKAAHRAWLLAVARMRAEYPQDDEVALQHALALIAVHGYNKDQQRGQSEAGAIALEVLSRRPEHPGAAHYVIHAFDNPEHAILALPAARTYARIAPAAGHALHMPSHTFTHLGLWRDVVASNERSYPASQAAAKALGQSSDKWDWHSYSWLVAAHLELGQPTRAKKLLDAARALFKTADSAELRFGYADVASSYLAQTGRWAEAEALTAPLLAPIRGEGASPGGALACAEHAPGGGGEERAPFVYLARVAAHAMRAEAALRLGDAAGADARRADIVTVTEQMKPWAGMGGRMSRQASISNAYVDEIKARAALVRERTPETEKQALDAVAKSVKLTDPLPIAGPAFFITARERLAEVLLGAGKAAEALTEYERVVDARPKRALSLLGAARAAQAAGEVAKARAHYATLAALWSEADTDLPTLAEVRTGGVERQARRDR